MFIDTTGRPCPKEESHTTVLTAVDADTLAPLAVVTPTKGRSDYMAQNMVEFLRRLGQYEVVLRTDGEPSIIAIAKEIEVLRQPLKTQLQQTPRYSAQSLGLMGQAQRQMQGQFRTVLAELEAKYARKFHADHHIFSWLVRHSAWVLELSLIHI